MLRAVEYLGKVGVGVTLPQFFRAHDGNVYVVKFQNNRLSSRVLVSELLAAKIGEIMGLCFPSSDIIEIDEQMVNENPYLLELGINQGQHFASHYLEHAEYVGKDRLAKAINVPEMAGVILFDHIFHNADRAKNQKNLLLRLEDEKYKIYAIDNSHLFRSSRWTIDSFQKLGTRIKIYYFQHYRNLLKDLLSPQDFLPYLDIVKKISNEQIEYIVQEIPSEWLPDQPDRLALVEYTKMRMGMADEIYEKLCRFIPKSRGGQRWLFAK
ncbi:HipA family kinase [Sporomusa sp.]|uniref:HipA family kinase n=1 Tax=Sporomusa sp. TaxID=2078658 RepID=UPI002C23B6CF|nr:HipA family kinase [Sporomusa sp.]HWR44451.1 HipA family kinase [Sporomusa sp.]